MAMDKELTARLIEQTRMQGVDFRPLGGGRAASDAEFDECADVGVGRRSFRCERPKVAASGAPVPCWHCEACLRVKRAKAIRRGLAGLDKPGIFVLVTLTAPSFVRPGVPVHVASKDGGGRCPLCHKRHWPEYPLSGLPGDFSDVDFMNLAVFNLTVGKRLNNTLTMLRKRVPGVEYFWVKDVQSRLAGHVHLLLRLPEEEWLLKLRLDIDMKRRGKRVLPLFVGGLRDALAPGWGPRLDIRLVGDLDEYADVLGRSYGDTGGDLGEVSSPVIKDARRVIFYMTRAVMRDGDPDCERGDGVGRRRRFYRHLVLAAVTNSIARNEIIPSHRCPVASHREAALRPLSWSYMGEKKGNAVRRGLYEEPPRGGEKPMREPVPFNEVTRQPLRKEEDCACRRNRERTKQKGIEHFGLGSHLYGSSRGW